MSARIDGADGRQKTMRLKAEEAERHSSSRLPPMNSLSDKQKQLAGSLLSAGVVTQEFLAQELKKAGRQAGALGKALLQSGYIKERELFALLVQHHKIPSIKISKTKIPLDTVATLPESVARKHKAIVLEKLEDLLVVVTTQIFHPESIAALRKETGCKIAMIACKDAGAFETALDDFYGRIRASEAASRQSSAGSGSLASAGSPGSGGRGKALVAEKVDGAVRPATAAVPDLLARYEAVFAGAGPVLAAPKF